MLGVCIARDPSDEPIVATYQFASTPKFRDSVGSSLLRLAHVVPDGLLVFLPSYSMMTQLVERWKHSGAGSIARCSRRLTPAADRAAVAACLRFGPPPAQSMCGAAAGVWQALSTAKTIFQEPRSSGELEASIEEYQQTIAGGCGALYMAVCRGKVSEGINFSDANARAVVLIGIPFPAFKDARVVAKKEFNDANRGRLLSGAAWYQLQGFRAMNQVRGQSPLGPLGACACWPAHAAARALACGFLSAPHGRPSSRHCGVSSESPMAVQALGRCIRHKDDYGAIILLDQRLGNRTLQEQLSKWLLRPAIQCPFNFGEAERALQAFFRRHAAAPAPLPRGPATEPCCSERVELEADVKVCPLGRFAAGCEQCDSNVSDVGEVELPHDVSEPRNRNPRRAGRNVRSERCSRR